MSKKQPEVTYDDLINYCCKIMIEQLCKGSIRDGVVIVIQTVLHWSAEQRKNAK